MKKRYGLVLLMLLFLAVNTVHVQAEEDSILSEEVTLTEDSRYKGIYYQEPEVRYPHSPLRFGSGSVQSLEDYVVAALKGCKTEIDVSAYQISRPEAGDIYFQILDNHPELFYVESHISYSYNASTDMLIKYKVSYLGTEEEIKKQQTEFETAADQVVAQVDESLTDLEKALVVHDYLVQNCEYDYDNYLKESVPDVSHSAYGALINKVAVCDGYSDAYSYIMENRLGIACDVISSDSMAHAWNMIELSGEWYHIDATWDDPTRDCIGRVKHNYFLLSDTAMSDSNHNHKGWNSTHTADSTLYDDMWWAETTSSICYYQNEWYYAKYDKTTYRTELVRQSELLSGETSVVYTETGTWNNYANSYMYPIRVNDRIYFNDREAIYRLDGDGTITKVYEPIKSDGELVFGFVIRGELLCYSLQATPKLTSNQNIQTYNLEELHLEELEGICAEAVATVYDGTAKKITVEGIQAGDKVRYAGEDGVYREEQPQMIDAGIYQVQYRVVRNGYLPFEGSVQVEIRKAVPGYTLPTGLTGVSGETLGKVSLPTGFIWQTDEDTKLYQEGTYTWYVSYVPEDTRNYVTVTDLSVEVTVSCPGHQYASRVTKEPTATEKGEETHTCKLCGDTYTTEVDVNLEKLEGIQAQNVRTVYDGTAKKITIEGTLAGDVIQYAGEDEIYREEQPQMINAGVYQVWYRIERAGYQPLYGNVQVVIEQAVPEFSVPVGLRGVSGRTLGTVSLPAGFVWQTDKDTKLYREGTYTWYVSYVPEDKLNYKTVTDIALNVTVSCPVHRYESLVTAEATETRKGIKTYTCSLCGSSYTEEISMLEPKKPSDVSGLKVKKNTANSLTFSWKQENGIRYRLVFYRGNQKVSTRYVTGNTCTYTKLKAATAYTLRITPYRVVNGQKVYAAATGSVKTATAPAAVNLKTVKKSGSSKAKLTWAKTSGANGYEIFMKTGNGSYKKIKTISKGKTISFTRTGLKKGKTYTFRIRAYKTVNGKKIYGAYSKVKSIRIS